MLLTIFWVLGYLLVGFIAAAIIRTLDEIDAMANAQIKKSIQEGKKDFYRDAFKLERC